ncbi:MAG: serine hydrolase [Cyclobacteriaceae bacterium]|nr:serine hydrolase [Cyclobacteriaceae bacterium]
MKKLFLLLFLLPFGLLAQKKGDDLAAKIKAFDQYVEAGRNQWMVPGMAVTVVKDGKVLLSKGYGVRSLGQSEPVDSKTLFACASTTKAMTAALMGMLVDEGKVNWNDPVIKHYPGFKLYDPYMTREVKIRDLFTHNAGMGNADFLWSLMRIPSDEVLRIFGEVKPTYSLRSSFIYQNIMYLVAGKVIENVSGKPWEVLIRERIFTPLGMSRSVPMRKDVTDPNQTGAHYLVDGKIMNITHSSCDNVGPAGSVWSCADDINKWMMAMLDSSKYAGGRLLKPATWAEMFKPQTLVPLSEFYPTMQILKPNWTSYGLGWFQHDYKGRKINYHTGSLAGAIAMHAQLPDEKLGIYIFGNFDHAELRHALVYKAFDVFALGGNRDWSTEFKKLYDGITVASEKPEKDFEAARVANTQPSHALEAYAGTYTDALFGTLVITQEGNQLAIDANNFLKAKLSHWHYDTFRGPFEKAWYGKVNAVFSTGADGKIKSVNIEGMDFRKN